MPGQMHCKRTVSPVKCWVGRWKVRTWCRLTEPLENGLLRGTNCSTSIRLSKPSGSCEWLTRLRLGDGSITYLGFGGTNGHEYTSLGRTLKAQGLVRGPVTIEAIREAYRRNPCGHPRTRARTNGLSFSARPMLKGGHRVRWDSR